MKIIRLAVIAMAFSLSFGGAAKAGDDRAQTTLRIGLAEDPDILDPTLARTYVGRIMFAGLSIVRRKSPIGPAQVRALRRM